MDTHEDLRKIVEELIDILHTQAEDLERLVAHVENQTTRVSYANQLPIVRSRLSELHHRARQISAATAP
ncbi:MAG: hypothetical protein ACYTJ0_20680 [Planctomycetota bacterium]|jgi:hypothetical protein